MTIFAVHPEVEEYLDIRNAGITDRNIVLAAEAILEDMKEPGSAYHPDMWPEWSGKSLDEWKKLRAYCRRVLRTKTGARYKHDKGELDAA
mgnify:FL=1